MNDWRVMTAADLGRGIGAGDIDPIELCAAFLDTIGEHDLGPRIYARTTPDRAMAEAHAAAQRARDGRRLSLLDGVPVSWKDLFDTAGTATEAGSALLRGRVPNRDAEVLRNATAMGLVCLGKTHMSELAFSGLGLNPVTETPPCVNDAVAVAGGSSSGAAASVAFGLAPAAVGSDTGGSVRIPAAWNDLVGLKTTSGRLSLEGVVPLCPRFDTVGPLTRSVEDAAHMLAALEGRPAPDLRGATLKGARIGVLRDVAFDDLRNAPRAAFDSASERLENAGARITDLRFAHIQEAMDLSGVLFAGEAYGIWRDEIEAAPHKMFARILDRFRGGATYSAPDYVAAWHRLEAIRRDWHATMAGFDAVSVSTGAILPPHADRLMNDDDYYVTENLLALRNTRIGNLMGLAVLTLPTGVPSCGLSLMSAPMSEDRLLRLGIAAEAALS